MQHIYLTEPVIWYPKPDCVYHIQSNTLASKELIATFSGSDIKDYIAINLSSGTLLHKSGLPAIIKQQHFFHVTKELLPNSQSHLTLPPILLFDSDKKQLITTEKIHYVLDSGNIGFSGKFYMSPIQLDICNDLIQAECQKITSKLPAKTSVLPIFAENKKPSGKYLQNLYQKFIHFNDKKKLDYQCSKSFGQCHIRAHFINALLNNYGITSLKIFKFWNPLDWKNKASPYPPMHYHCAAMIIDKKNNKWIWDPWFVESKTLLTMNQWLNRGATEPTPTHYVIASPGVISILSTDFNEAHDFMKFSSSNNVDAMQAMISGALPNPITALQPKNTQALDVYRKLHKLPLFKPKDKKSTSSQSEDKNTTYLKAFTN